MDEYSVLVEARQPDSYPPIPDPEEAAGWLASAVEQWSGAVQVGPDRWSVRLTVERAEDAAEASRLGREYALADEQGTEPEAAEPYALLDVETVPVTYYQSVVKVCVPGPDGAETVEVVRCPHRFKHETEERAMACARQIARERGVKPAKWMK